MEGRKATGSPKSIIRKRSGNLIRVELEAENPHEKLRLNFKLDPENSDPKSPKPTKKKVTEILPTPNKRAKFKKKLWNPGTIMQPLSGVYSNLRSVKKFKHYFLADEDMDDFEEANEVYETMLYLSYTQFFESLLIHLIYSFLVGPLLYLICLPWKSMRNYIFGIGLLNLKSGISWNLFLGWICFVGTATIRFGLRKTDVDDLQVYTFLVLGSFFCIMEATRAFSTHHRQISTTKRLGKLLQQKDYSSSIMVWNKQATTTVSNEIDDSISRQEIDVGLMYVSFFSEVNPEVFTAVPLFYPQVIEIDADIASPGLMEEEDLYEQNNSVIIYMGGVSLLAFLILLYNSKQNRKFRQTLAVLLAIFRAVLPSKLRFTKSP